MSAVLAIAGVIIVLDQLTKLIVLERLSDARRKGHPVLDAAHYVGRRYPRVCPAVRPLRVRRVPEARERKHRDAYRCQSVRQVSHVAWVHGVDASRGFIAAVIVSLETGDGAATSPPPAPTLRGR